MSKLIKNLWVCLLGFSVLFASEEWTKNKIKKLNLSKKWSILISPVFNKISLEELANWILQDNIDVRLQLQMHKYIWDPNTRAV